MAKVNLDALIRRKDLEVPLDDEQNIDSKSSFSISDLKNDNAFGKILRKPDFQRETNDLSILQYNYQKLIYEQS